jgi:NUMOD3 motif
MRRGEANPFYGKKHTPEVIESFRQRARLTNARRHYDISQRSLKAFSDTEAAYLGLDHASPGSPGRLRLQHQPSADGLDGHQDRPTVQNAEKAWF